MGGRLNGTPRRRCVFPPLFPPPPAAVPPADHGTIVEGKVAEHDTIGRLLKHHGLTAAEADEVIRSLSGVLDFRTLKNGEPFRIERGKDGRVQHFELALAKGHKVHTDRQPTGELVAKSD